MKRCTNITKQEIERLLFSKTITETAGILDISRSTLVRRMKEYGIAHPIYVQSAETRKLRSEALKQAHIADPTLAQRQTKNIREWSIQISRFGNATDLNLNS